MIKQKHLKNLSGISPERLMELRRKVLVGSTGSSLRLSDSKITDEQVLNEIGKSSEQK